MEPRELKIGEIVQIIPKDDRKFGGCLMIVTEPKSWGAQGYVESVDFAGPCYFQCPFADIEPTGGMAKWIRE